MSPSFAIRYELSISAADVGSRVSVRRKLPEGGLGDVLGELTGWADGHLTVRRKDGSGVRIPETDLIAGKVVPARRVIARRHDLIGDLDLEEVAALGWQGLETARLGGWLLRASGGWTGRANSALPLGDPGLDPEAAIDAVTAWYTERGLSPMFQVPVPLAAELDVRLGARGWECLYGPGGIHLMSGDIATVLQRAEAAGPAPTGLPPVTLGAEPSPGWLGVYRYRDGDLPPVAVDVLRKAAAPVFAEVTEGGATLATGRGAVDAGWLGIFAMETAEAARRRGLAGHVMLALLRHAAAAGARHVYLQVSAENTGAVRLYTELGLTVHHKYHYRRMSP
ncbi:GNAT family N-acetyltransferase [Sporichthya sp.]|uniref:GNAT family N-acetyltransferase n=1 Tax=Sporichthya sp. TaxID=65475 RepID=UPI00185270FF|nr:GNAT family N-acetyltransferase [Sporichthya sp.]MBA3745661.1 GNAT family N-acetyltransferase [Sporichthya sp.]